MTKTELQKKTKAELLELAKKQGVKVGASATKDEIITLLMGEKASQTETPKTKKSKKTTNAPKISETVAQPSQETLDPIMAGESKKFEIEDYRQKKAAVTLDLSDIYEIPESYNENRLTLLVQDPYWIHAYWDLTEDTKNKLRAEGLTLAIRLFYGEKQTLDIEVNMNAKNWYINVPMSNTTYRGELGYIQHGVFVSLTGSNHITVPRDKPAEKKTPTPKAGEEASPSLRSEETVKLERQEKLFERSGGYVIHKLVGSEVVSEWISAPSGLSSGQVSSGSGGMAVSQPPRKRKFWAELHTELIVYGATEPTAKVTLGGVPIQLTPEGTFSIRFYLKDGSHSVPFVATSEDGVDTIEITPFVNKYTTREERTNF
ncbi:DUF4912 domain-containing protein [Thermospira aquatica]|uniref:DUF4912 domain-containing protein n=1 Tax=Thermospira aquatica TaxID=2828656 RepID=A0AAX3BFV6_9SPIR|nr:DUF4912 domain-containing protein [Thermospira aquatica]URA10351.1 DUF4912 domain-containing protein [Thermospira aquatica]